jgi:flagellar hook-basal body complex protein FliE
METANADMKDRSSKIQSLVTEISTSAPSNGDLMVTALKNAIANANQVYESSQKAIKQVIDISTQQTKTMTDAAIKASEELSILATKKTL